jgi:hypothetical protein
LFRAACRAASTFVAASLHPRQDMAVEVQREYDFCSEADIAFLEGGEFK